jgi:hypothetical protein
MDHNDLGGGQEKVLGTGAAALTITLAYAGRTHCYQQ